jgi:hypothetical protein
MLKPQRLSSWKREFQPKEIKMPEVSFTHSGSGSQDGSQEKPYTGGIILHQKVTGSYTRLDERARWIKVNPCPDFGYRIDWIKKEGLTPICTPAPIHNKEDDLAVLELIVELYYEDGSVVKVKRVTDQVYFYSPKCPYHPDDPPPPPPDPPPPDPPPPTDEYRLQICYAPLHGREYDVNKSEYTDPVPDVRDMKFLGAKYVNLWLTTTHLFHNTKSFNSFNPTAEAWYKAFFAACEENELKVVGKLPLWGIPSWYDQPGVPEVGSARYYKHLLVKQEMADLISREFPLYAIMLGNEPQNEATVYPNPPGMEDPSKSVWHTPEDCLQIAIDVVERLAPLFDCEAIGPASSGAIKTIRPGAMAPVEFITRLKPTLIENGIKWASFNPYVLTFRAPPGYSNYSRHYQAVADIFPLWPSECNIPREHMPSQARMLEYLRSLITEVETFSHVFSYFLYRDFQPKNNWGLQTYENKPDAARRDLIYELFGGEFPSESFVRYLQIRTAKEMDTGIYLMAKEAAHVKITFISQRENSEEDGAFEGTVNLTLGAYNPVTKNVKADFKKKGDLAVIVSNVPVACASAWPAKFAEELYTIFPGLEL